MSAQATAAITFARRLLSDRLEPGRIAVDATAGNGNDAVFLARLVTPGGTVHCFDIQPQALARTRELLEREELAHAARFHEVGHERLLETIAGDRGRIAAVVFNLGFLPGGDEAVITKPETTIAALEAAKEALAPDGAISVVCYAGHPGGGEEAARVQTWCEALDFDAWRALRYELVNKPGGAIRLFFIERSGKSERKG